MCFLITYFLLLTVHTQYVYDNFFFNTFESEEERSSFSTNSYISFEQVDSEHGISLKVDVPDQRTVSSTSSFDIEKYRGDTLQFECLAKGFNISQPSSSYRGVKLMLVYEVNGVKKYPGKSRHELYGDFDWTHLTSNKYVIDENATNGIILIGLQDVSGEIWFDNVSISRFYFVEPEVDPSKFYKGHSLPRLRGVMASTTMEKEHVRILSEEWNANAIRLQINSYSGDDFNVEEYYKWINGQLLNIDNVVQWCEEYGILVAIDMHYPIGGRRIYESSYKMRMYENETFAEAFIDIWKNLTERYKDCENVWAYDIINEPLGGDVDCLPLIEETAKEIRKIDSKTAIIVSLCNWGTPSAFDSDTYVMDITNLIYTTHIYDPHSYTHQGVNNISYPYGVAYPGEISGKYWNKSTLREQIEEVRRFSVSNEISIYVGEFSVIRWAEGGAQYLSDVISLMEEYGWDYTYHAYREWSGWNLDYSNEYGVLEEVNTTDRKEVVLSFFEKNYHPGDIIDDDDDDDDEFGGSLKVRSIFSFILFVVYFSMFF